MMTKSLEKEKTILIVDDNRENIKVLSNMLKKDNYKIHVAINGLNAVESVKLNPPDIILMDIQMPVMDGYTSCREIKKSKKNKNLPVIFISAMNESFNKVEAFKAGGVDYIPKPFQIDEVKIRIKNQLDLYEYQSRLIDTNKELESFTYTVSHDLRSPLRHINSFSNMLYNKIEKFLDDDSLKYFNNIKTATIKMEKLIDDLINYSKMSMSKMTFTNIDLKMLVYKIRNELNDEIKNRKIKWLINDLPTVNGDLVLLEQLFNNIIMNAVKYTGNIDEPIIKIGSKKNKNGENIIYIKDNGIGFDKQYKEKIFEVFQRLHTDKEYKGSGIGLAIVKRIIDRHSGKVWAEGKLKKGATFYILFP